MAAEEPIDGLEPTPDELEDTQSQSGVGQFARDRAGQVVSGASKRALNPRTAALAAGQRQVGTKAAAALAGGPIGTAIGIVGTALESKTIRWGVIAALILGIFVVGLGIFILIGIFIPGIEGFFGTTYGPKAVEASSREDMDLLRYGKCLDKLGTNIDTLPDECDKQIRDDNQRAKSYFAGLRKAYEENPQASKALGLVSELETLLGKMEQAGKNVAALKGERSNFIKKTNELAAELKTLAIRLDVPIIDQPRSGACGYTSVAMIGQYFLDKAGTGQQASVDVCYLPTGINSFLRRAYPDTSVQYSEYAGPADATYFSHIIASLSKGAPVLLATDFYIASNEIGHYIVLTGYDPATKTFWANNPLTGGSQKDVTTIDGVTLTVENIQKHARHSIDGIWFGYYAGTRTFR